jgi:PIN domain nuclease of toxin-antitoxin system
MRLLLDTHIFIGIAEDTLARHGADVADLVESAESFLSVASIWEMAIKVRLGKLGLPVSPDEIAAYCESSSITVLPITARHATEDLDIEPETNDPFDRLLLAQCAVEGLQLLTVDQALAKHPMSYRTSR